MENTAFFGGASPSSPAAMATFIDAKAIYRERRSLLRENLDTFLEHTKPMHLFTHMEGHPSFSYEHQKLTKALFEQRIIVTNFNYPNDGAHPMSRIVLSAAHTKEDTLRLSEVINHFQLAQ